MSKQQRFELVQSLKARGVRRFITYTNSPDMLHVDLKEMPNSKDGFWYMHDKSARNFGKAPDWMQAAARTRIRHERLPAAQPIELDENFEASDPGNFYQGKNPFQAEIDDARASRQERNVQDEPPAAAPGADIRCASGGTEQGSAWPICGHDRRRVRGLETEFRGQSARPVYEGLQRRAC
ncbi:hypothetical protein ELZ20_16550 [Brucella abortus]|nr:hypothetical protein ELZ20_16550 [Brucella abortus]